MATKRYTRDSNRGASSSKFGQMIGEAFESVVIELIRDHIDTTHPEYELLEPSADKSEMVTITMLGGSKRQLDTVVMAKDSDDPVALLKTKWLKDARHHNDKGAWILQLREVQKKYATVRGAAAILAGYWTEGVAVVLMSEGGIKMVLVATDEEIYSTLQGPLDEYLGEDTFKLEASVMRKSYPRPWDLANLLIELEAQNRLAEIAASWLKFERDVTPDGIPVIGEDLVRQALDQLLSPLPKTPRIATFEIALQVDTGNTIYQEFTDVEEALEFIQTYFGDSEEILRRITPRRRS